MKRFFSSPHNWFLITIPLFYAASMVVAGQNAIDIQLHDTMFVFAPEHFYLIPCLLFFIWSAFHATIKGISRYQPNKFFSLFHFLVTIGLPSIVVMFYSTSFSHSNRYYNYSNFETTLLDSLVEITVGAMLVQLIFLLYLFILLARTAIDKFK